MDVVRTWQASSYHKAGAGEEKERRTTSVDVLYDMVSGNAMPTKYRFTPKVPSQGDVRWYSGRCCRNRRPVAPEKGLVEL
ncbi:hypothetical protein E4U19_007985 [Claviceps sp. Clav32 group G5]|nr:hypothetical protein E4U19_007985 [Claviceps sp. Clav32 group G5]